MGWVHGPSPGCPCSGEAAHQPCAQPLTYSARSARSAISARRSPGRCHTKSPARRARRCAPAQSNAAGRGTNFPPPPPGRREQRAAGHGPGTGALHRDPPATGAACEPRSQGLSPCKRQGAGAGGRRGAGAAHTQRVLNVDQPPVKAVVLGDAGQLVAHGAVRFSPSSQERLAHLLPTRPLRDEGPWGGGEGSISACPGELTMRPGVPGLGTTSPRSCQPFPHPARGHHSGEPRWSSTRAGW